MIWQMKGAAPWCRPLCFNMFYFNMFCFDMVYFNIFCFDMFCLRRPWPSAGNFTSREEEGNLVGGSLRRVRTVH